MKANELRIGNYVSHEDYTIESFKVISITLINDDYEIMTSGGKHGQWVNCIDLIIPIPITEEWLLKFCFEKLIGWDDMIYFNNNGIHIYLCGNGKEDWFEYENDIVIKSVHQLQNLYFALTGEELTTN